ncbi:trypsin-like serine peptidase [Streptomyces milbemycinicus]|uniref:Trypsin-like serine peptidase n=1 Tax=Streptomyces milbemycinicus TaxID=476552 RepID=A0ABW8LKZ7_9ACTN
MKTTSRGPLAVLIAVLLAVAAGAGGARAASDGPHGSGGPVGSAGQGGSGGPVGAHGAGGASGAGTASAALTQAGGGRDTARAEAAEAVRAYWTPERMRHAAYQGGGPSRGAIEHAQRQIAAPAAESAAEPTGEPGSVPPAAASSPGAPTEDAEIPTRVGRILYVDPFDGKDKACDGNALNSGSRRLVVTSGSCVYSRAAHAWMNNWVFIPGYFRGNAPYGKFVGDWGYTFNAWIDDGNMNYDFGLATTHPNESGQRLVDRVGGDGLAWNQPREEFVSANGYSVNSEIPSGCGGYTRPASFGGIELPCAPSDGGLSRGGRWLMDVDPDTTLGHVNGVTSIHQPSGFLQSPYVNTEFRDFFYRVADS